MTKYTVIVLFGLLMPFVSFAQVAGTDNAGILQRISALEAQVLSLQHLLDSIVSSRATSTPALGSTVQAPAPAPDPIGYCNGKPFYVFPKAGQCNLNYEVGG